MRTLFSSMAILSLEALAENLTEYQSYKMNVFGSDFGTLEFSTDWNKDADGECVLEFNIDLTKNNLYNSLSTTKQIRTWWCKKDSPEQAEVAILNEYSGAQY